MTLSISLFSIMMVILASNHPTNSGAVPKSNLQQEVLANVRMQRSLAERNMEHTRRGRKSEKKRQKNQKKSAKKQERKPERKGHKTSKRVKAVSGKRMSGTQRSDFELRACDYVDLVEIGHRQRSDWDCGQGQKFVFKVFFFVFNLLIT